MSSLGLKSFVGVHYGVSNSQVLTEMVGCTPEMVTATDKEMVFYFDEVMVTLYHEQDCCEDVHIDDINGDLEDLCGTSILVAEERVSKSCDNNYGWDTETWTFYTFRALKGSVDVRWHGSSNGYYSEEVDIRVEGFN